MAQHVEASPRGGQLGVGRLLDRRHPTVDRPVDQTTPLWLEVLEAGRPQVLTEANPTLGSVVTADRGRTLCTGGEVSQLAAELLDELSVLRGAQ